MKEIDVQGSANYGMRISDASLRRHITHPHGNVQLAPPIGRVLTLTAQMAVRLGSLVLEDYG